MAAFWWQFLLDEQGQDLVEYTLIITFVLFAVVGLAGGYHSSIASVASTTNSNLSFADSASH
jgi:Flp pilus assembly pilin Flp